MALLSARICFAPCTNGMLVLDLAWGLWASGMMHIAYWVRLPRWVAFESDMSKTLASPRSLPCSTVGARSSGASLVNGAGADLTKILAADMSKWPFGV
jgi:hypothetical protein